MKVLGKKAVTLILFPGKESGCRGVESFTTGAKVIYFPRRIEIGKKLRGKGEKIVSLHKEEGREEEEREEARQSWCVCLVEKGARTGRKERKLARGKSRRFSWLSRERKEPRLD